MISETKIVDNTFKQFNWGPALWSTTLPKEICQNLLNKSKKNKKTYRHKLASLIDNVNAFEDKDLQEIMETLMPYVQPYVISIVESMGFDTNRLAGLHLDDAWVNFQKQYETNPEHTHDGDFSFVIYLQIPSDLKKEYDAFEGRGNGPGGITFRYGESVNWCITHHNRFPEEGELYIFPSKLSHWVNPFKTKCERISLAGNISIRYK
jgi:hypothetical protein